MRNSFLWSTLLFVALAGLLHASSNPPPPASPLLSSGRVLIVEHPRATEAFTPQPQPVGQMVRRGLLRFTDQPTIKQAWLSLLSPEDVIGLKVHSAPGRNSGTRVAVVAQIIETLLEAGFQTNQIVVWDRRRADLRLAGFYELRDRYGIAIEGSVDSGYDPEAFYSTPLLGNLVYGDLEFGRTGDDVGRNSHVSKLITQRLTKIINVTPLLNHNRAGVSGALWGLSLGSVDNTLRFDADPARLAVAIPEIYARPELYDRVVLNIVDALICQYQGEETTRLHFSVPLNEIWFSKDPVALDVLAIQELERQRKAANSPEIKINRAIYENSAIMDLGTANPRQITTERLKLNGAR